MKIKYAILGLFLCCSSITQTIKFKNHLPKEVTILGEKETVKIAPGETEKIRIGGRVFHIFYEQEDIEITPPPIYSKNDKHKTIVTQPKPLKVKKAQMRYTFGRNLFKPALAYDIYPDDKSIKLQAWKAFKKWEWQKPAKDKPISFIKYEPTE